MIVRLVILTAIFLTSGGCYKSPRFEQRHRAAPLRTLFPRYNAAFFYRHNEEYRFSAAIHYAHGRAHDDLQLTPLTRNEYFDDAYNADYVRKSYLPPWIEPSMMYWGPFTGQAAWRLYLAIDWTHHHHEMTYDVLSDRDITWQDKKKWTDWAVEIYLHRNREVARSPAPLELTMRRAGVMMKPYFTYFRTYYPKMNNYFYVAHWWHPVIYEAMMIAGNDDEQDVAVQQTHDLTFSTVFEHRPVRMLLSREAMPRYSRLTPESANIFDNLHMLHGIAYDIMAYEGWSLSQKREELYRVIEAMSYHPGDENYTRKFDIPHPNMDPRIYYDWMRTFQGAMNDIMETMFREMWPKIAPGKGPVPPPQVLQQLRLKLYPGMQPGEKPGSLSDALRAIVPGIEISENALKPGVAPEKMVKTMLDAYFKKVQGLPDVAPISMAEDPRLPLIRNEVSGEVAEDEPKVPE